MAYSPRDPGSMTDSELLEEIRRLDCLDDQAATRDPVSLLHRIMRGYRIRPHLEIIAEQLVRVELGKSTDSSSRSTTNGQERHTVVGGAMWWLTRHPPTGSSLVPTVTASRWIVAARSRDSSPTTVDASAYDWHGAPHPCRTGGSHLAVVCDQSVSERVSLVIR